MTINFNWGMSEVRKNTKFITNFIKTNSTIRKRRLF